VPIRTPLNTHRNTHRHTHSRACAQVPRLSAEQLALKRGPAIKQIDENEPALDKQVVDNYLARLRAAIESKSPVTEVGQVHKHYIYLTQHGSWSCLVRVITCTPSESWDFVSRHKYSVAPVKH